MAGPGASNPYASQYAPQYGVTQDTLGGSVPIVGGDITPLHDYELAVSAGAIPIVGTSINVAPVLVAGTGSVDIVFADLPRNYELAVSAGSVLIAGIDANLERNLYLSAEAGAVTVSGIAASLLQGYGIAVSAGAIEITGGESGVEVEYALDVAAGAVAIAGVSATMYPTFGMSAGAGYVPISITGVIDNDGTTGLPAGDVFLRLSSELQITCPVTAYTYDDYLTARLCRCE